MDDDTPRYVSRFTSDLESRLYMPRDGFPSLENCHCTPPTRAVMRTVWDSENRGRRVLKCGKPRGEACSFGVWMDGPINGRAKEVINFLYATLVQVTQENTIHGYTIKCMEEELLSVQKDCAKKSSASTSSK